MMYSEIRRKGIFFEKIYTRDGGLQGAKQFSDIIYLSLFWQKIWSSKSVTAFMARSFI